MVSIAKLTSSGEEGGREGEREGEKEGESAANKDQDGQVHREPVLGRGSDSLSSGLFNVASS